MRPPEAGTAAYAAGLVAAGDARRLAIRELADLDPAEMREPERVQLASMLGRLTVIEAGETQPPTPPVSGAPEATQAPLVGDHGRTTAGGAR